MNSITDISVYLTRDPLPTAQEFERQARVQKIAYIVSSVAFLILTGIALAVSAGLTTLPSLCWIPLIVVSILCEQNFERCVDKNKYFSDLAITEKEVHEKWLEIQTWNDLQIDAFHKENKIIKNQELQQEYILRGIARYSQLMKIKEEINAAKKKLESNGTSDIGIYIKNRTSENLQNQLLPRVVKAAQILQILHNPTLELSLDTPQPITLSYETVLATPDPSQIRPLLFPLSV
jgi:hypothetical protein